MQVAGWWDVVAGAHPATRRTDPHVTATLPQPLTADEVALLGAVHVHGNVFAAAAQLRCSVRCFERALHRLSDDQGRLVHGNPTELRLTASGLALLAASREYLRRLEQITAPADDTGVPTVRLAVIGSRYQHVAVDMATGQPSTLLSLTETTAPDAVRRLEAGAVDAAYVWESDDAYPTGVFAHRVIATEQVALVIARRLQAGLRTAGPEELAALPWVSTPSGEPLARTVLQRMGVRDPAMRIVDCVVTLQGLVALGEAVSLASPLTRIPATDPVDLLRLPVPAQRRLVLWADENHLGEPVIDRLASALRDSYRSRKRQVVLDRPLSATGARPDRVMSVARSEGTSLDEDDIAVLQALASEGSVNRAASQLCLTQPALSRRIQRMEERLGARIIERSPSGSTLTAFARRSLKSVEVARAQFAQRVAAAHA